MNYIITERGLGIVVLGEFTPLEVNINSLVANHVIRQEEVAICHQDMADADMAVLNVGNIRIMCDRFRFQVATIDTQIISRMLVFCRDFMNVVTFNNIRGVGVNPHMRIKFSDLQEYNYFISHVMPSMESWNTLLPTGQVTNMNVKDGNKSINVKLTESNKEKFYVFDINLHSELNNAGAVIDVLDSAIDAFDREQESLENFLKRL